MSVLVKGMKMPKSCAECYFLVERFTGNEFVNECDLQWHSGRCREEVDEECEMGVRSETCPLVEVPTPHGRLIDAADLLKTIAENAYLVKHGYNEIEYGMTCFGIMQAISEAPTIIEAEEEK